MKDRKLLTEVNIQKPDILFRSDTKISGIGSCFVQYVMEHFFDLGMNVSYNPNGIAYNSYSIYKSLEHLNCDYDESSVFKFNEYWHSWEHHGSFSSKDKDTLLKNINEHRGKFLSHLKSSELLILTESSSVAYKNIESNSIVANCHKVPNTQFQQVLFSKDDNYKFLSLSIEEIRKINNNCLVVITLSPVRHYPGNLILNARSKANLLSAIHDLVSAYDNVIYFPSYEIMIDELRDYRFYDNDMLHPSVLAREIIFEKFIENFFAPESSIFFEKQKRILKQSSHRQLQK